MAVNTPTSGAMNSGFSPLSMSGGMMVSVMADAASCSISDAHGVPLDVVHVDLRPESVYTEVDIQEQ